MKVNFGCGTNRLAGWENYDAECDITLPLRFQNNRFEMILCEHCVEHVSAPQAFRFFQECLRILEPGGVLRLCVPILNRVPPDLAISLIVDHGHLVVYSEEILRQMLSLAGFVDITVTERKECDGHWKVIGKERDDAETLRVEAKKACPNTPPASASVS